MVNFAGTSDGEFLISNTNSNDGIDYVAAFNNYYQWASRDITGDKPLFLESNEAETGFESRLDMEEVYRVPKWVAGAVLGLPQGERYTGMAFGGGGGSKIGPEPGDISEMSDSEPEQPDGDEVDSSGADFDLEEEPSKVIANWPIK